MSNDWQQKASTLAETNVLSWRQIATALQMPKSTVSDYLRKISAPEPIEVEKPPTHDNSRILFISDLHAPYQHEKALVFLEGLKRRYEPTRIICLGDCLDKHAMSFHDSDPDLDSAGPELERGAAVLQELERMFPAMDLLDSNHGSMVYRKAKHHGIPRRYIRPYSEVIGVGEGWQWHMDLTLDLPDGQKVYVHHGKSSDALKVSQAMGMSHVCGHYHESFGVKYWANPLGLYWAMNAGCLIEDKSLAFAYNNANLKRPIIGTGLVIDGIPILEAMSC